MKFTCSVTINAPINKVVELFTNREKLKEWQDGYVGTKQISGTPGTVGAKSKITYKNRKHLMEITETIMVKNLPSEITALYEHEHMVNTMRNNFTPVSPTQTKWESNIEYTKFIGFIPNLMSLVLPGVFKKQTQKWLDNFKVFAEKELQ